MATRTKMHYLGADVSKDWLDIFDGETVSRIANRRASIRSYLKGFTGPIRIAVEPTHRYHLGLLELGLSRGAEVFLVDPYRLSRYREAVGERNKTDARDARLLVRYLEAEGPRLRPYRPAPKAVEALRALLRARSKLVSSRLVIEQSLSTIGELAMTRKALLRRIERAIVLIDGKLERHVERAGYGEDMARCRGVPGIGALSGAALVATYRRGEFASADAFVAFIGLDIRVRESGRYRGLRKLSKRGDPECRRLLFNAARSAAQTRRWRPYYDALRGRGYSSTAAYVALARKLVRLVYALLRDQSTYREPAIA